MAALTVTDGGSAVGVTGDITVGQSGSGTLQVEAGAALTSSHGNFVVQSGSADIGTGAQISAADDNVANTGSLSLAGGTLTASGSVSVDGTVFGAGTIAGAVVDDGSITASGGTLVMQGSVSGTGKLGISGATLELQEGIASGPTIDFAGGTLVLDTPTPEGAIIADFGSGDAIVLKGVIANAGTFVGGHLVLDDGGAPQAALSFTGAYTSANFDVTTLGNQTTVNAIACFAAGTRIATQRGPVPVEALQLGDEVIAMFGGTAPVVWLGHRRIDRRYPGRKPDLWPVRIRAGAFGPGRPAADMRLSPDHAVYVENDDGAGGALIPVRHLINGTTILQEPVEAITYWHVELPEHDVILAEGLACESYLDTGDRASFANGGKLVLLWPEFAQALREGQGCAELVVTGPRLHAARRRLAVAIPDVDAIGFPQGARRQEGTRACSSTSSGYLTQSTVIGPRR